MDKRGISADWSPTQTIDVAELLQGLSGADVQAIMNMTVDHTYAPGACVIRLGHQQQGLYLVKKGLVEEFRLTENGTRLPINRVGAGKLLALASMEGHYCCFAEAVEETVIGLLSFHRLEELCPRFPKMATNLVKLLSRRLGELEDRLELLVLSNLRARVAGVLLRLYTTHGPHLEPITHEALGEWAVSSRPKVSVVLEELQKAGLVRLSRGEIQILDPAGLEDWARR